MQEFLINIFRPAKTDRRGLQPTPMAAPSPTAAPAAAREISRLSIKTPGAVVS
jgi:hypothetical protein